MGYLRPGDWMRQMGKLRPRGPAESLYLHRWSSSEDLSQGEQTWGLVGSP